MEFFMMKQEAGNVAYMTHIGGMVAAMLWFKFIDSKVASVGEENNPWRVHEVKNKKSSFNPFEVFKELTKKKSNVIQADFTVIEDEEPFDFNPDDLDKVLKKVSSEGFDSLSEKEKDFLLKASETMKTRGDDGKK
jgi:hypothetical protein